MHPDSTSLNVRTTGASHLRSLSSLFWLTTSISNAMSLPVENNNTASMKRLSSGPLAVVKFLIKSFSTVRQRDPPSMSKTCHVRLITIGVSHYCEKARFALDLVEADESTPYYYTEDAHPPPFHAYETLKATNHESSITPMAVFEENNEKKIIIDSSKILKHFMPELYPKQIQSQVEAVEADLGKRLGPTVRCFVNYHLLYNINDYHAAMVKACANPDQVAKIESILFDKLLEKGLADGMKEAMGIDAETCEVSVDTLRQVFAEYSQRLEESGGEYLLDTKERSYGFTAADLTFAALAYPLLRPPELDDWHVDMEKQPPAINAMAKELQTTKAGQHALRIYAKHRLPKGETKVTMKYSNRSRSILPSCWPL